LSSADVCLDIKRTSATAAYQRMWPTMWNEFLPISMPTTAIAALSFWDKAGRPTNRADQVRSRRQLEHRQWVEIDAIDATATFGMGHETSQLACELRCSKTPLGGPHRFW